MSGHQAAAADLTYKLRNAPRFPLQFGDNFKPAHSVSCDDIWIIVRRSLDSSLDFGNFTGQSISFTGLMISGNVVRSDFRPETACESELYFRCRLWHHNDHPLSKGHSGK